MYTFAKGFFYSFVMVVLWLPTVAAQSVTTPSDHTADDDHPQENFDAGKFVIDHVLDAYDWHIATIGNRSFSVPLPVILYSNHPTLHEGKKWHLFMSSKFHHGKEDYLGFRISQEEEYHGKIVEINSQGTPLGRPLDLSMTKSVSGLLISVIVLFLLLFSAVRSAKINRGKAPSGTQNLIEPVVIFIRDEIAIPSIGEEQYKKFMAPLLTLFTFILINNLLGLIPVFPFGANITGNISVTLVLALFTFVVTNVKGNRHYWKEIFNPDVPLWLKFPLPLMPLLEIMGLFTKPFVLMVRLFANMMAGHMIITVFISLIFIFSNMLGPVAGYGVSPISVAFSVFITLLDLLVSFIQAYVFTLLSAIYFGMASAKSH